MILLAFFAHPDDETMLSGGALALLANAGVAVHYLCATRGEGGEVGEPPLCSIAELGQVREQEMTCAVHALGGRSLRFLDYTDPRVGPDDELYAYSGDLNPIAGQVNDIIRQIGADVVLTHGSNGEYGHPAHRVTHQAARLAVEMLGESSPLLYTVSACFPDHPRPRLANRDDRADIILDVTPVLEQKTKAALCHRTQHALFIRRSSREAGRQLSVPEVIMPIEALHRAYPPPTSEEVDAFTRQLGPWQRK